VDHAKRNPTRPDPPTTKQAWASFGLLLLSLVTVVGLAKMLSPTIERAVETANAPRAVVGIVIAALVLLPETWAAVRAARADRLQNHFVIFAAYLFLAFVP
jgi:Ca2+:H+ antiporter